MNRSGEDVVGDVTVNRQVADRERGVGVTFHQFVVAVPSEDVRELSGVNTTMSVSRNRHLTTVANVIDRQFDCVDDRNRIDHHCVEAEGFASGVRLEHTHPEYGGLMDCRGQSSLCSTPDLVSGKRITSIPSVGQIAIVVVTEVSGQRHHTVCADRVFRGSDFNNNRVIYIYIVRGAFNAATMRVVNHNGVNVRVILRTLSVNDRVVTIDGSRQRIVVEQPSVGQLSTHIVIGDISIQFDDRIFADDRVASDNHRRVRVNRQGVRSIGSDGQTAGRNLRHLCTVNIGRDVAVNRQRAFREDGVGNTFDQFVVTIPSEDVLIARHTASSMSHNRHLTTVAYAGVADDNRVNNRIINHFNVEGVNSRTVGGISQCRVNLNKVSGRSIRRSRIDGFVSTKDSIGFNHGTLVPLVDEVIKVVILKCSRQCHFAAIADGILSSNNVSDRSFVNNHLKRITECGATVTVHHFNCVRVCPVDSHSSHFFIVECINCTTRSQTTVTIPIECSVQRNRLRILSTIDPSEEADGIVFTNKRVTFDNNNRVTGDCNRIRDTSVGVTATRNVKDDSGAIDIVRRIIVNSQRAFAEPRTTQERVFEAISEPFVSEQRRVNGVAIEVSDRSSHIDFTTVTNLVRIAERIAERCNVHSSNLIDFERGSRPYIDGIITPCHTTGAGLGDLESKSVPQGIHHFIGQPRFGSIRNCNQAVLTSG